MVCLTREPNLLTSPTLTPWNPLSYSKMNLMLIAAIVFAVITTAAPSLVSTNLTTNLIDWIDCPEVGTPSLKCANFSVPIDWSDPNNGQKVRLGLTMRPAQVESKRIGTLMFDTGGPGAVNTVELVGNGTAFIPFSENIRDRFDLVALDPRGIGASQALDCDADLYNEAISVSFFVNTQEEFEKMSDSWRRYDESCINKTGPLIRHVDSVSAARDFEAVRVALGNEPLNYIGLSYGTMIAQAYLELFPNNVRAMVMDGNVDHSQEQIYNVLTESRTYERVIQGFFDWCQSDASCAIHNDTLKPADLWEDLIARANRSPILASGCTDPANSCKPNVTSVEILFNAQQHLLFAKPIPGAPDDKASTWPGFAEYLHQAYYANDATAFATQLSPGIEGSALYLNQAVMCLHWNHTVTTLSSVQYLQQLLNSTAPHTKGACEFYEAMIHCLAWPISPQYPAHPTRIDHTSAPILIVECV